MRKRPTGLAVPELTQELKKQRSRLVSLVNLGLVDKFRCEGTRSFRYRRGGKNLREEVLEFQGIKNKIIRRIRVPGPS